MTQTTPRPYFDTTQDDSMEPMQTNHLRDRRIVYISWAESCSRSDHTARELGGKSYMVYLGWLGSHPATILIKYLGQFLMTCWILIRERPRAVFVMSPPLVAAFPAFLYRMLTRRPYVLDCHTAAYNHPRWNRLQWLQHFLGRKAATNIVTNDFLANLVKEHGGRATIVRDVPVVYEKSEAFDVGSGFSVAAVCSFNPDEPIAELIEAARLLPDVQFFVTGNTKHLADSLLENTPVNMQFTGFISDEAFGSLLSNASAVMSLTTRDHTMLRGAWEAIYQERPVIVSDWPCLREAFNEGAVFANNDANGIAAAINQCREQHSDYVAGAVVARKKRIQTWLEVKQELLRAVGFTNE